MLAVSGVVLPASVDAQVVTVSGIVVERGQPTPVGGAVIRLTGFAPATTGVDGRFRIEVPPGRHTFLIEAFGYVDRSRELLIRSDTTLRFELDPDPVVLDSINVSASTVTVRGNIRDGESGLKLLNAQVIVYPGARTVGALSGSFTLRNVARGGPISLRIEAIEYLPAHVDLIAERDTTLDIALAIDSVAVRMIARQVERIAVRARAIPLSIREMDRDDIRRSGATSLGETIVRRLGLADVNEIPDGCLFYDDMHYRIEDVVHLPPEQIERIEIFGFRGSMIRVYSRKYVARLMRTSRLNPIMYMRAGLGTAC